MVLEGIVIHKQAYKERDIIATFLLRSGDLLSGYFYGGQGGGSSKKSDILQIGYCLKFKVHMQSKKGQQESHTYKISDWSIVWQHEKIRNHYKSFVMTQYLCELFGKISHELHSLEEIEFSENQELFSVLSNAIYYLDKDSESLPLIKKAIYAKLSYHLGIAPDINQCDFCQKELRTIRSFISFEDGRAICENCLPQSNQHFGAWVEAGFSSDFTHILQNKFQDIFKNSGSLKSLNEEVLEKYFWNHLQLKKESFKTLS